MLYNPAKVGRCFGGTCRLHFQVQEPRYQEIGKDQLCLLHADFLMAYSSTLKMEAMGG
jgi:hypothetical protein